MSLVWGIFGRNLSKTQEKVMGFPGEFSDHVGSPESLTCLTFPGKF